MTLPAGQTLFTSGCQTAFRKEEVRRFEWRETAAALDKAPMKHRQDSHAPENSPGAERGALPMAVTRSTWHFPF